MRVEPSSSDGPLLDALLVARALQDVADENPRRDHVVRIDLAGLHQVLHLGDRHVGGRRHHRIEVPRRAPIQKITNAVAPPPLDKGEIGMERRLEDVRFVANCPRLFSFGDERPITGRCIEAANAVYDETKNGYDVEMTGFGNCFVTADMKEGTTAFVEKRKAIFAGK